MGPYASPLKKDITLKAHMSFQMGTTPIEKMPSMRNMMMVRSVKDQKMKKVLTNTVKLALAAKGKVDTERSSVEMNLGSFQAEKMDEIDPLDFIDGYKFSKRDFLLELFKEYNKLPIKKSLQNFAFVFNDVFLREIPSVMASYCLFEIQIVELSMQQVGNEI